jgi:hypothetical protein
VNAPYLGASAAQLKEIALQNAAEREEAKRREAEEKAKMEQCPESECHVDGPGEGNCEVNCLTTISEEETEQEEFTFDPNVGGCEMLVGINVDEEIETIEFSDSWQCRRYNKSKHQYVNIYVELYGYNVFGLQKSESFSANGAYQGVAFRDITSFDVDIPFSEAGVCYKVRPKTSSGRWTPLECFRTPLPPELLGPPDE